MLTAAAAYKRFPYTNDVQEISLYKRRTRDFLIQKTSMCDLLDLAA